MNSKAFLLVVMFLLLFIALLGGLFSSLDLTPDTPLSPGPGKSVLESSSVQSLSSNPSNDQTNPCASPYQIQAGDTLSAVAARCNLALSDILAANSDILNPDLIHPGQNITLPYIKAVVKATQPSLSTQPPLLPAETESPPVVDSLVSETPAPQSILLGKDHLAVIQNVQPDMKLPIYVVGMPPNVGLQIQLGPPKGPYSLILDGVVDGAGNFQAEITIPNTVTPGEKLTVAALSVDAPVIVVTSEPFQVSATP